MRLRGFVPASPATDQNTVMLEQAALSEALLDNWDIAIMTCDEHGRLNMLNRAGRDLYGLDVGDSIEPGAMADSFAGYRPDGAQLPADQLPLLRALAGERVEGVEIVVAPPGRPRRLVSCSGRQIRLSDGSVLGAVISIRDVTSQRAIEAALSTRAGLDELGGLPRRLRLERRTDVGTTGRGAGSTALLFIELDHIRTVVDAYGQACADQVLRQAGRRLDDIIRASDTVTRLGGDAFVVVCPDMAVDDDTRADRLASRISGEMRRPFYAAGATVQLSASIGLAVSDGEHLDGEALVAQADAAMLAARASAARTGLHGPPGPPGPPGAPGAAGAAGANASNDIATYSEALVSAARPHRSRAAQIEQLLHRALEHGSLDVHYQPVVDLASGRIVGVEALARLTDDSDDPVPPAEFIGVAEQCGLVGAIGELVLRRATVQAAHWKDRLPRGRQFALGVNLSVRQLSDPALFDSVLSALTDSGLDPDALVFELTESVFSDTDQHARMLRELRALGPKLSIDDFGTGYSSLSYLRRFDVDILKIDQTFVADLGEERDRRVTGSIITMAHDLGLPVIAEGIETVEQLAVLRELGCPLGQGNLLAPAETAATISERLGRSKT